MDVDNTTSETFFMYNDKQNALSIYKMYFHIIICVIINHNVNIQTQNKPLSLYLPYHIRSNIIIQNT